MAVGRAVLEILCYVIPAAVVLQSFRRQKGIAIDHVFLFSAAFVFYFVIPLTLGRTGYFVMYQTAYLHWRVLFDRVTDAGWVVYFASSLALYAAFLGGDMLAARR